MGRTRILVGLLLASCVSAPIGARDGAELSDSAVAVSPSDFAIVRDAVSPDDASCVSSCVHPSDCPGQYQVCCVGYSANTGTASASCTDYCPYIMGTDTGTRRACDSDDDCLPGGADAHAASFCCPFPFFSGFCGKVCLMDPC